MVSNLTQQPNLVGVLNDNKNLANVGQPTRLNNLEVVSIFQKALLGVRAGSEDYYAGDEFILAGNDGEENIITYPVSGLRNLEVING